MCKINYLLVGILGTFSAHASNTFRRWILLASFDRPISRLGVPFSSEYPTECWSVPSLQNAFVFAEF